MILPPARRISASFGLLALVPIGWMLASGSLTPMEASIRAAAVLVATLIVARIASWSMLHALKLWAVQARAEQQVEVAALATEPTEDTPRRRSTD